MKCVKRKETQSFLDLSITMNGNNIEQQTLWNP